jgi:hypothetical protein
MAAKTERPSRAGQHGDEREASRGGMPGDGAGRRDEPGVSGVHPASAGWPEDAMPMRSTADWGHGDRAPEGDEDAGTREPPDRDSAERADAAAEPGISALVKDLRAERDDVRSSPAEASEATGTGTDR